MGLYRRDLGWPEQEPQCARAFLDTSHVSHLVMREPDGSLQQMTVCLKKLGHRTETWRGVTDPVERKVAWTLPLCMSCRKMFGRQYGMDSFKKYLNARGY